MFDPLDARTATIERCFSYDGDAGRYPFLTAEGTARCPLCGHMERLASALADAETAQALFERRILERTIGTAALSISVDLPG